MGVLHNCVATKEKKEKNGKIHNPINTHRFQKKLLSR
jgi:hypothetical protein